MRELQQYDKAVQKIQEGLPQLNTRVQLDLPGAVDEIIKTIEAQRTVINDKPDDGSCLLFLAKLEAMTARHARNSEKKAFEYLQKKHKSDRALFWGVVTTCVILAFWILSHLVLCDVERHNLRAEVGNLKAEREVLRLAVGCKGSTCHGGKIW